MDGAVYSVDRMENEMAVLVDEDGGSCHVSITELPPNTKTGDMVHRANGVYYFAESVTKQRRSYVLSLQEKLRKNRE